MQHHQYFLAVVSDGVVIGEVLQDDVHSLGDVLDYILELLCLLYLGFEQLQMDVVLVRALDLLPLGILFLEGPLLGIFQLFDLFGEFSNGPIPILDEGHELFD